MYGQHPCATSPDSGVLMKMNSFFVAARANLAAWALTSEAAAARLSAPSVLLLLLLLSLSTPSTTSMRRAASCSAASCVEVASEGDAICRASRCAAVPVLLLLLLTMVIPRVLVSKDQAVMGCAAAARLRYCAAWACWCR